MRVDHILFLPRDYRREFFLWQEISLLGIHIFELPEMNILSRLENIYTMNKTEILS